MKNGKIIVSGMWPCTKIETRLRNLGVPIEYEYQQDGEKWDRIYIVPDIDIKNALAWEHIRAIFGTDVIFKEVEE